VFLCRKVLHPWVSVKRQPTYVAVDVVEIRTTSKNLSVHHAVTVKLLVCVNSIGPRRLIVLRLETGGHFSSHNGYKASSTGGVEARVCVASLG